MSWPRHTTTGPEALTLHAASADGASDADAGRGGMTTKAMDSATASIGTTIGIEWWLRMAWTSRWSEACVRARRGSAAVAQPGPAAVDSHPAARSSEE